MSEDGVVEVTSSPVKKMATKKRVRELDFIVCQFDEKMGKMRQERHRPEKKARTEERLEDFLRRVGLEHLTEQIMAAGVSNLQLFSALLPSDLDHEGILLKPVQRRALERAISIAAEMTLIK